MVLREESLQEKQQVMGHPLGRINIILTGLFSSQYRKSL
jgi:hypothetical protein